MKIKQLNPFSREDFLEFFKKLDGELQKIDETLELIILGGAAITLLNIKERATHDLDIAPNQFNSAVEKIIKVLSLKSGIIVQQVTVSSTVDFIHGDKEKIFEGRALHVQSISPQDLIKSKLERFLKQDPEDIYAIIEKTRLSYASFSLLVNEMLVDYVGNTNRLMLQAAVVVEQMYPGDIEVFKKSLKQF